jgi:hypothetical protein
MLLQEKSQIQNSVQSEKPLLRKPLIIFLLFLFALGVRLIFVHIAGNNTTDAWSRYHYAVVWLQHPASLPQATATDAWLPLHFWLLGGVVSLTGSEMGARIFTALLGSLTVVLVWSIIARTFDRRIATVSAVVFALFGFHIAFSVTTSSEAPTIFFIASGLYAWLRFAESKKWLWALCSALALGAANLCRFEPWLCAPLLAVMLLDTSQRAGTVWTDRPQIWRAGGFLVLGSAAAMGWLIFSFIKWGDPMELPHRTMWLNLHFRPADLHHSLIFRFFTVPLSILISISPVIAILACFGLLSVFADRKHAARPIAVLVIVLFAFNFWNSVRYEVTQARYTLLYTWLLIPFAFEGLRYLARRWPRFNSRGAFAGVMLFFVFWQAGIMLGAAKGPYRIADRLAQMSPALPLQHEMRLLTSWILKNHPSGPMILDDFNWDSRAVARVTHLNADETFQITAQDYVDQSLLDRELGEFIAKHHPDLLIASPDGPIGKLWSVDDHEQLEIQNLSIQLKQKWKSEHWRVYEVVSKKE